MKALWLLPILSCLCLIHAQDLTEQVCSTNKQMVDYNYNSANVIIGGFFSISSPGSAGFGCGPPSSDFMQVFEAAKFAIDYLNDQDYLPGVNFGMRAYDTCGSPIQSLNYLQELFPSTTSYPGYCSNVTPPKVSLGVLGPLTSVEALQLADMAGKIPVAVLSPEAMTSELSDKMKFPTFLRTIPSLATFSRGVAALLKRLAWKNTFVVYTDDAYGTNAYQQLLEVAEDSGICISHAIRVSSSGNKNDYKMALQNMGSNSYAGAVVMAANAQAQLVLQASAEIAAVRDVQWILSDIDWTTRYSLNQMRGVLTLLPKSLPIDEFRDYFIDLEANATSLTRNPWFKEWYEIVNKCSLTGVVNSCPTLTTDQRRNSFVQSPFVVYVIKAVFAYAEMIRRVCGNTVGVCQALRNMDQKGLFDNIAALDFTFPTNILGMGGEKIMFDDHGDPEGAGFDILSYMDGGSGNFGFQKIGIFQNEQLTLNSNPVFYNSSRANVLSTNPTSFCPANGCSTCLLPPLPVSFYYKSGDFVLASLVTGHEDGIHPLSCSRGLKGKLVSLTAMEWAVNRYKQAYPGNLNGVSLGSLVADVCSNPPTAQGFLSDLLSSNRLLDSSGAVIPSQNIHAFVDDTSNNVAQAVSHILSQHMIPEVQVGATSPSIMQGEMYPYFARAVPNDEVYAKAISTLLMEKRWMHVQVVTDMSSMYHPASQVFRATAARHGICVVQIVEFADGAEAVVNKLLGYSQALVVVVFGDSMDIKGLLAQLPTSGATDTFQIIAGTKEWATDQSYTAAGAQFAITFGLQLEQDTEFQQWLDSLSVDAIRSNMFLSELFEMTNECSLLASTRGLYSRVCNNSETFRPYQANAPYVIQSVYHIADQLHALLREICGNGYSGMCSAFRSTQNVPRKLYNKIVDNARGQNLKFSMGEGVPHIVFYVVRNGNYDELVHFDTENQQLLSNVDSNLLNPKFNVPTTCPGYCVECQYLYNFKNSHMVLGDWNLVGIFSISLPGPPALQPYICGNIRESEGAQYSTAMFYALDQVNKSKAPVSVKGINIGGLALDHCGNEGLTKLLATDMYAGFLNPRGLFQESILAWLTDTSSNTNEVAEILDPLGVAIVSPSATSTGLSQYENFFATIQSDAVVSTAIVKLAKQLGFRYLQLVYAANDFGRDSKVILTQAAQTEGICISRSIEFGETTDASLLVDDLISDDSHVVVLYMEPPNAEKILDAIADNSVARENLVILLPNMAIIPPSGSQLRYPPMSIRLRTFEIEDYEAYLRSNPIDNVFFARYYMELFECNLNGYSMYDRKCPETLANITDNPKFVNSEFELATINAVYASVDALDRTVKEYCGQHYTQPCAAFLQASDKRERFNRNLNRVNFVDQGSNVFRFIEREGNVAYIVSQYDSSTRTYKQQGTYAGVALNIASSVMGSYTNAKSGCSSPCLQCSSGLKFSLTEGDIYLGGVFDVHGPGWNPFICGNIKTLHGYLLLEAFHYALAKVNAKEGQFKDILKNTRLGGVGLDACSSRVRGGYLVSNVNNRQVVLSRGSVTIDPDEIDAYVGSYSSSASMYLARILTDLKIPQISFASTTTDLNDKRKYPYFYRTVPSNDKQAVAMLHYLNENNIRYVQIVYQGNNDGMNARDEFVKISESFNICVAQAVVFPDLGIVTSELSKIVVATLLENPAANTVVTFLDTDYINSVLSAIDVSEDAHNTFRFLGSDSWADNLDAYTGAERHALDSVTLKVNADDVQDFEQYINSKNLANNLNNPWFEEYFQRIHNCYTSRENMATYRNPCPDNLPSIINSINYQQDPGVVFVINSVYAAAFAIDTSLKELCGTEYSSVCQAYRNNANRRDTILKNLASVEFSDPSDRMFRFKDNQAQIGYRFYALVPGRLGGIVYDQIGTYDASKSELSLKNYSPTRPWKSGCDREDACTECPAIRYRGKRYVFAPSFGSVGENATTVIALFDIHKQGADPYRCGELNMPGFQQFLSFFYSLEQPLRAKVQGLRVLVIDTCSNPMHVDQDLFGLLQGTGLCNTLSDDTHKISYDNVGSILVSGEHNTQAAARVLEPLEISYVSPNAMSTSLDHKMHLARTVSPVSGNMKFIADMLDALDCVYVDALYQDVADEFYPWEKLSYYLSEAGICLGRGSGISDDDSTPEIQNFLRNLNGYRGVKAVILLGNLDYVKRVLTAANGIGVSDDYVWIVNTHMKVTESFVQSVAPASGHLRILALSRISETDGSFTNYVRSLKYEAGEEDLNNGNIPGEWFEEFFQISNDCRLSSAKKPMNANKPECNITTDAQKHVSMEHFEQDKYIMNTIAATYAVFHGPSGFTDKLNTEEQRENILTKTLATEWNMRDNSQYSFSGTMELLLKFNNMRWWDPGYIIMFWDVSSEGVENPKMWNLGADLANDDIKDMKQHLNISSSCQESVSSGYCGCKYEKANTGAISSQPLSEEPRNYYRYDSDGDKTYDWPVWAVVVAVLTIIGLLVTLILFLVLLVAYPKKGGTSTLGYMVIFGIFCIYGINFAFFFHATDALCGVRRFLMGVVYTITFAPLLIKAIDNWRFGHVSYSDRRYSGISSWLTMLLSAWFIVLIQCIVPIIWLILEHPTAVEKLNVYGRDDHWWCEPTSDYDLGLVFSFSFVIFVILITAIFSALAYDTDTNNYESRWILFGCIITAGCFLVWMIVMTNARPPFRDPTVAIANFVNATLLLIIIPFRKAVLMCQAMGNKYDSDDDRQEPYNMYQNGYGNEGLQLDDYDNQFVDSKPSEF